MGSVTVTPTIVVGLGNAGCRMAAAVNERAVEEDVAEYVEVLGIDSHEGDVDSELPTDASSLVLERKADFWEEERGLLPYIDEEHELSYIGAARQRPVGRYFLDNPDGLDQAWQFLQTHTEEFVNDSVSASPVTELNVWVVNSLAGGTGSGIFPLVAGLLDEVLAELEAERGIETTLRGVGSLLRLDRLAEQVVKPANQPSYYLNAYTALSELQALLDEETVSISLHSEASQFVDDELEVSGVFDQYLLVGIREQRHDYLNSVNRMVADAIYYFGAAEAIENFPDHPQVHPVSLFSLDAGELTFPVETADQYVALGEEIARTREERDRLEREREERADDLHYLDTLLSLERDSLPSSESPIPRTLVRRCEDEASAVIQEMSPEELDRRIDEVVAAVEDDAEFDSHREFDSSEVVRYLLLSRLIPAVEQECARTYEELSDLVTTLVDAYRNSLQQYFPEDTISNFDSSPVIAADKIAQFLENERERLIDERENSFPFIDDFFRDLEARIQKVEQSLDELYTRQSAYEQYVALSESVHNAFEESRDSLSTFRMEIEKTRHELDDQIDENTHEIERMQMHRERLATELSEHTRSHYRTSIPVEQPERLNTDILERAREDGFTALVEAGFVESEAIEQALEQICSTRQEPIQDRQMFQPPFSVLAPILAEENTEDWLDDIDSAAAVSGFDMMEQHVDTTDTLSIGLLGLYADIDLEATSEFGTLDEYFTDPDRELSELFGSEVDNIPNPVAYPELR